MTRKKIRFLLGMFIIGIILIVTTQIITVIKADEMTFIIQTGQKLVWSMFVGVFLITLSAILFILAEISRK